MIVYTLGPSSGRHIFDIFLRFRLQQVTLIGDMEKAFLIVSVCERDRDSPQFLWAANPNIEPPEIDSHELFSECRPAPSS